MKLLLLFLTTAVTFVFADHTFGSLNRSKSVTPSVTSQGQTSKSDDLHAKFVQWKKTNKKHYENKATEVKAERNFVKNVIDAEAHNQRLNETFKRGTSEHSDMTYDEKKVKRMGLKVPLKNKKTKRSLSPMTRRKRDVSPPASVDYRPNMTAIKNQADCGACWSFASTSVLEYQIKMKKNVSIQLSEQEMIDCNTDEMSCDGGWPTYAYNYVIANGLSSENSYEYLAYNGECLSDRFKRVTKITDTCELEMGGDEESMKWLVANYGAVVVTIWATEALTSYKSGVYFEKDCPQEERNHAIAIVGYGTDPQYGDFWWIRNSWGTSWGIDGYGKYRRFNNTCGITNNAMFPCDTNV